MPNTLKPHGLKHSRLPCPSPTPGACSNSCPLSQWWMSWMSQPFNNLVLCPPLLPLPSIFPSLRVFSSESVLHTRWPKYWSFSFSISLSNEYSGLISFRMDWFYLLVIQGTHKSLLQHHSSKASILQCSAFFMVQLSHPYVTAGKPITLYGFAGKVMSLFFNMLSRTVIAFLPRNKHLLTSLLQPQSAVIFGAWENKVCHCFHCFPIYFPWSDGTGYYDLHFWMLSFKPAFLVLSFTFITLVPLCFLP